MQNIERNHRFENIEFEVSLTAGDGDGCMISHYLRADHGKRFGLGRINFARHDGRSGFVGRQGEFSKTGTRSGAKQADIVGDLVQAYGQGI